MEGQKEKTGKALLNKTYHKDARLGWRRVFSAGASTNGCDSNSNRGDSSRKFGG